MISQFDGDLALILTPDGGNIHYVGGQPIMDPGGLETSVGISLFTGETWWANAMEANNRDNQIGSDFEDNIIAVAITLQQLNKIKRSAEDALKWMTNIGAAQSIIVDVLWPGLNAIQIAILITKHDGDILTVRYDLNWIAGVLRPVTATTGIAVNKDAIQGAQKNINWYGDTYDYDGVFDYDAVFD